MIGLIGGLRGKTIGVLGLAFKPGTDDIRESPAVALVQLLLADGASVLAHDPVATQNAARQTHGSVRYVEGAYDAASGADALVIATGWNEYMELDLAELRRRMRGDVLFDARNLYDPRKASDAGFRYAGMGRSAPAGMRLATP